VIAIFIVKLKDNAPQSAAQGTSDGKIVFSVSNPPALRRRATGYGHFLARLRRLKCHLED